jgi:hypothetical protein
MARSAEHEYDALDLPRMTDERLGPRASELASILERVREVDGGDWKEKYARWRAAVLACAARVLPEETGDCRRRGSPCSSRRTTSSCCAGQAK